MAKRKASDFTLMIAVIFLVFIGIVMVFSSSYPDAYGKFNDPYHFLKKQLLHSTVGLVAMIFFMNLNYKLLNKLSKVIFLSCLVLTGLLFTPMGLVLKGGRRWITLGFTTFMPSEAMKLGSIIFLCAFLSKKKDIIKDFTGGVIPALLIIGIACGSIIIQKDLSTSVVLGMALVIILFLAGMKLSQLFTLGIFGIAGIAGAILAEGFRVDRVTSFLNPFAYKSGIGWQAVQSLYALGSGGLFGLGLGQSRQKFFYIPEPYNDFIFSIIGEELGFIGCVLIIILILIIIWRGIRISLSSKDMFGCLLSAGIVGLFTVQSLVHIAVVTSSMPPTGIPLPLVSEGGTSILVFMSAAGILLNISRYDNINRS
ncbi:putative lipid II flippase FtsW [Abyssisolibacter fermentans]|uniref:putative lipid II flippase FtsW n=1 Tax=Abyssisolibacter fermentans TaxID=1766203 RepID=UPI00082FAA42|nr:putative lipid II flippase FtsW [Abyssisolibacter fermentans]